jgi:hypothetical protein
MGLSDQLSCRCSLLLLSIVGGESRRQMALGTISSLIKVFY